MAMAPYVKASVSGGTASFDDPQFSMLFDHHGPSANGSLTSAYFQPVSEGAGGNAQREGSGGVIGGLVRGVLDQ